MRRCGLLVIAVLVGAAAPSHGGKHAPAQPEQKIKDLIDQLVSPNPKPITAEEDHNVGPHYRLPPGFDREKQKPVSQAHEELEKLGTRAFPFLIDRWGDKRYSFTTSNELSGWCRNQTVGKVCQTIIYGQLQPYGYWQAIGRDPRGTAFRPRYPETFLSSKEAAKQWWEKRKEKRLDEMQLEVLDWVIAEEAKHARKFSDKERQYLKKVRQTLSTSGKPLPPGSYYLDTIER